MNARNSMRMSLSGEVHAPIELRFARVGRKLVVGLSSLVLAACSVGAGNGDTDLSASPAPKAAVDASLCGPLQSYYIIANSIDGLHVANMGNCVNVYNDGPLAIPRLVGQVAGLDGGGGFVMDCVETRGESSVLWVDFYSNGDPSKGYVELAESAVSELDAYQGTPARVPACPPPVNA